MLRKFALGICCAGIFVFSVAAAEKPELTIVHLTDLHYTSAPPEKTDFSWKYRVRLMGYKLHKLNLAKSRTILEQAIEDINEGIQPDFVVITGDIVNIGDDKQGMEEVKGLLKQLNYPYYPVIGDHDLNSGEDQRKNYKEVFGEINYSVDYKDWHIIFLGIYPQEEDLRWLKEDLDKNADKPAIICMHRMLVASNLMKTLSKTYYCPSLICPKEKEITEILKNHGKVVAVVCGHSHTNYIEKKDNILHICTASLIEIPYEYRVIKVYRNRVSIHTRKVRRVE